MTRASGCHAGEPSSLESRIPKLLPQREPGGTEAVNIGPLDGRSLEAIFFADHAALEDADAFTVLIPWRLPSLARFPVSPGPRGH
jgi:hypothetical protein